MLTIIIGRAGTGKTGHLLKQLCENGKTRKQVYIVPEQYSHETERRLCEAGGPETSDYAEVLSFTRLASRVFAETGGLNVPVLDAGGRLLLMHRAVKQVEGLLTVYRRPSKRASFLTGLLATGDELKSYCVRPEQLLDAGQEAEGEDGEKLRDLGLILSAYDALTAQRAQDPRDRLTRLAESLKESRYLAGADVYADCFTDFTPQEQQVLSRILMQANSLTIALTGDITETGDNHAEFVPCRRAAEELKRMAKEAGSDCRILAFAGDASRRCPELNLMESEFFNGTRVFREDAPGVELYTAERPMDEAEYAAGRILELAREKGWRWRDIGVAVRSMGGWEDELESVFRRYGIPVFLNRMTDILQKPVLTLITAALDAVSGGFEYDDMFRYLKTGLTDLKEEDRDRLENYVLQWDIRGTQWTTDTPWNFHPEGYAKEWSDADRQKVEQLDALRRSVIAPFKLLKKNGMHTGAEWAQTLYAFLEEIRLVERLEQRTTEFTERGDLNRADEYAQLWEILCGSLEQCADLLQEDRMELTEFSQLFQLVLSQYDVGSIPVALDRVSCGDATRMAHKHLKALFVLGAEDSAFPMNVQSSGLLNDDDRSLLASFGLPLARTESDRMERELAMIYEMLAQPTELLVVSHADHSASGEEQRPSFIITRLGDLFPHCVRVKGDLRRKEFLLSAPGPALEYLAESRDPALLTRLEELPETAPRARRLQRSFDLKRGSLSPEGVRKLYTETVRLSASKMDKLKGCHFAYFMQYGLRAETRKQIEFGAPDTGTFVHHVLENLLKGAKSRGGVRACSEEDIREMTARIVEDYIREMLGGLEDKPQRFRYLFNRLLKSVDQVVKNVVEELRSSEFEPIHFELGFGDGKHEPIEVESNGLTLSITGFVDRVDGWVKDGRLYYRVVDYKTGKKEFDFADVWNGLGLQMLIYLFTIQELGPKIMKEAASAEAVPSGVLYLPAREVIVPGPREMDEDDRRKAVDKELKRSGLLLEDQMVLTAMENPENGVRFLPVRVNKAGIFSGEYLASTEKLGRLKKHIGHILEDIGSEFAAGNIDADPYFRGVKGACTYCEFRSACQFEEGADGCKPRYMATIPAKEFWEKIDKETEAEK